MYIYEIYLYQKRPIILDQTEAQELENNKKSLGILSGNKNKFFQEIRLGNKGTQQNGTEAKFLILKRISNSSFYGGKCINEIKKLLCHVYKMLYLIK